MQTTTTARMTPEQEHLWRSILDFEIDPVHVDLPFAARLARENHWALEFAQRVVDEYKKFVFLAMAAGHPVTPSEQVDQAWHLHLTYTRSYWERLCRTVLPRPLHHEPTRGGATEDQKFHDWYDRTKQSYRRLFAQAPPADIWPDPAVRFDDDVHFARVHTRDNLIIPRRTLRRTGVLGALGLCTLGLAGCATLMVAPDHGPSGFMIFAGAFLLLLLVMLLGGLIKLLARHSRQPSKGDSSSGCGGFFGFGCGSSNDSASGCGSGCGGGGCGGGGD